MTGPLGREEGENPGSPAKFQDLGSWPDARLDRSTKPPHTRTVPEHVVMVVERDKLAEFVFVIHLVSFIHRAPRP